MNIEGIETGPSGYRSYPRRRKSLESVTIRSCHYEGSTFFLSVRGLA